MRFVAGIRTPAGILPPGALPAAFRAVRTVSAAFADGLRS
jgi:hypothetical protein